MIDETYEAALQLVDEIGHNLDNHTGHYWTKGGRLLTTLDEVVRAILADDLFVSGN